MRAWAAAAALAALALGIGCQREQRDLRLDPPVLAAVDQVAPMANGIGGATPDVVSALGAPYETNAYNLGEGKRLYTWFNCKGCHADGGGASGPALMDGWWRYGADSVSVFVSLRDGRPNGMPAFRDKLNAEQIWQLVGYVRSIGVAVATTGAPSRNDEMQSRPAESRSPAAAGLGTPPSR